MLSTVDDLKKVPTPCSVKLKFCLLRHYWWALALLLFISVSILLCRNESIEIIVTVAGTLLSLIYFIQKQRLEERRLFRELFREFNERYEGMNRKLARISAEKDRKELAEDEKTTLVDYFNLCGEEYLYFRLGYIDPVVWESWENGMTATLRSKRVMNFWKDERGENNLYYGLPL